MGIDQKSGRTKVGNLEGIYEQGMEGKVPVEHICGSAGTGKTFLLRQRIAADPDYGMLCSTTGISAVNLGAITINSLLGYFDTNSLSEAFFNGWVLKRLTKLCEQKYKNLVLDELSMMDGVQLDIIYQSVKQLNEMRGMQGKPPLGIVATGDFAQLPPIKAKWAFESDCWPFFEAATTRLTKVYRQSDAQFLDALNHIRAGRGMVGATILSQLGVEFVKHADTKFSGTTIMAKNDVVDNFNWLCHSQIPGIPTTVYSNRWVTFGRPTPGEWKHIPPEMKLKPTAYVMILANSPIEGGGFSYVNGDCGHVVGYDADKQTFTIRLVRNQEEVEIGTITRKVTQKEPPDELLSKHPGMAEDDLREMDREPGVPYWDKEVGRDGAWVTGAITFYPLRLAYASTTHKCQGISLDSVQIDLTQNFFSAPSMVYVALSRARTHQGLRIVGSPALLGSRCHTDPAVQRWL